MGFELFGRLARLVVDGTVRKNTNTKHSTILYPSVLHALPHVTHFTELFDLGILVSNRLVGNGQLLCQRFNLSKGLGR